MNPTNLCEKCGRPEKDYSVTETNAKLRKVAKGPAGRQVVSFICSRCVQRLVNKVEEEKENVPKASEARVDLERKGFVRPVRPSNG